MNGVQMHWRAKQCRTCRVKLGIGNCPDCVALREAMFALGRAVHAQYGKPEPELDPGWSTEADEEDL